MRASAVNRNTLKVKSSFLEIGFPATLVVVLEIY
jgi:hypothetical protein